MTQSSEDLHPLGARTGRATSPRSEALPCSTGLASSQRGIFGVLHLMELSKALPEPCAAKPHFFFVGIGLVSGPLCSPSHRGGFRWVSAVPAQRAVGMKGSVSWGRRAATPLQPHFSRGCCGVEAWDHRSPSSWGRWEAGEERGIARSRSSALHRCPCSPQHPQQGLTPRGFPAGVVPSWHLLTEAGNCTKRGGFADVVPVPPGQAFIHWPQPWLHLGELCCRG